MFLFLYMATCTYTGYVKAMCVYIGVCVWGFSTIHVFMCSCVLCQKWFEVDKGGSS